MCVCVCVTSLAPPHALASSHRAGPRDCYNLWTRARAGDVDHHAVVHHRKPRVVRPAGSHEHNNFRNECCKVSLHDRRRRPVMDQEPTQHSGETALRDRPRTGHARRASLRDRSGRGGRLHAHESGGAHQEHFYSVDGGRRHARPCREAPLLEDATPISRRNSPKK